MDARYEIRGVRGDVSYLFLFECGYFYRGRVFWVGWSRGLGGPSRSRPPLRTPPGTLRVSLQGGSLGGAGPHVGRGPPQDDSVFFAWVGSFWLGWSRGLGSLPGAVLSCFGKKVPKEGGYWGGAGVEPFWLGWSRGLGGPSRSRPPLRTPPGTLRVSLQGESLGVIIFDPSPKGIPHLFTTASSPDTLRVSLLRGVWGERVLTLGGALLRTTVASGDSVADHFPLSTVHSFPSSRYAACFVAGRRSGESGSSRRAGPSSGRQWFLGIVSLITFHFPLSTVHCQLSTFHRPPGHVGWKIYVMFIIFW